MSDEELKVRTAPDRKMGSNDIIDLLNNHREDAYRFIKASRNTREFDPWDVYQAFWNKFLTGDPKDKTPYFQRYDGKCPYIIFFWTCICNHIKQYKPEPVISSDKPNLPEEPMQPQQDQKQQDGNIAYIDLRNLNDEDEEANQPKASSIKPTEILIEVPSPKEIELQAEIDQLKKQNKDLDLLLDESKLHAEIDTLKTESNSLRSSLAYNLEQRQKLMAEKERIVLDVKNYLQRIKELEHELASSSNSKYK